MSNQQNPYADYLDIVLKSREILKPFSILKDIEEAMSYFNELKNPNYDFFQMKSKIITFIKGIREDPITNFIDIARLSLKNNNAKISLDKMQENDLSASIWFEIETLAIKGMYDIIKIKNAKQNINCEEIISDLIQGILWKYFSFIGF